MPLRNYGQTGNPGAAGGRLLTCNFPSAAHGASSVAARLSWRPVSDTFLCSPSSVCIMCAGALHKCAYEGMVAAVGWLLRATSPLEVQSSKMKMSMKPGAVYYTAGLLLCSCQ